MPDDVVLNKAATIERCLARIRDVYANDDASLIKDITKQDSIVLISSGPAKRRSIWLCMR